MYEKPKFKLGEKVVVYAGNKMVGTITGIGHGYTVKVPLGMVEAHEKQLRKLVKKKRRSVWVNDAHLKEIFSPTMGGTNIYIASKDHIANWHEIEIREVKK